MSLGAKKINILAFADNIALLASSRPLKARRDFVLFCWWGKIVMMDHSRLTYCVSRFRKENSVKRSSWCGDVTLLQALNLAEVWDTEEIGDLNG